jgi:ABC-type multidrug transport system ATPase subunit
MNESNKLAIAWIDLKFTVKPLFLGEEKVILNQICGGFEFGSINALMGGSGSGKTTLLKCLYGKSKSGLSEGTKIFLSSSEKISACFISRHQNQY